MPHVRVCTLQLESLHAALKTEDPEGHNQDQAQLNKLTLFKKKRKEEVVNIYIEILLLLLLSCFSHVRLCAAP